MNTKSPAVAPDIASPDGSHPEESSPNDQLVVGESEAMRRVQDLLAAGKLSVSDSVVFEYYFHAFTARVMADGSLRSQTKHKTEGEGIDRDKSLCKLYSSPSEFASAMATSVALLDDKATRTKGKISINGWNSCTVNGRSLATIRNEMLYERKNELASLSTERVRESAPVEFTGKQLERLPEESSTIGKASVADISARLINSSQGLEISSRNGTEDLLSAHHLLAGKKKLKPLAYRGDNTSGKCTETTTGDERGVSPIFEGTLGADSSRGTHPLHESTVPRTSSSPELPINPISKRACTEHEDSLRTSAQNAGLRDRMRQGISIPEARGERSTLHSSNDVVKLATQKYLKSRVAHSSQLQGNQDCFAKDDSETKDYADITGGQEKYVKVGETSTLAAEPLRQVKAREHELKNYLPSVCGKKGSPALDRRFKSPSSPRAEIDLTSESNDSFEGSKDNERKKDNRLASVGQRDKVDTAQRENVTLQARSSKEVSDLQQEILGDSDSDEESFLEREEENIYLPKKRCRSPSSNENRKKTRIGDAGPEMDDSGIRPGNAEELAFEDKTLPNDNTNTEIEPVHLDPDTVEAAAIAAQIEKEEASTRARRTTRLAAGKIKQVDYKASTGLHVPRGISPEFGWEENNKHSIEIESSMDIARTSRRRTAPNQWQPPQRSSRRVAKLRNSCELSNEETDCHDARPVGGGFEIRNGMETTHIEDTEGKGSQGFRQNVLKSDSNGRRGRTESSSKKTQHHFQVDEDPDSRGRTYNVRASTGEDYIVHGAEIADLSDPDDLSDVDDLQDASDADDGSDQTGPKIDDIKCLAEAVRLCESADPRLILGFLNEHDNLKNDDLEKHITRGFLQEIIGCIQDMPTWLAAQKDTTCPAQLLSFLSAEIWRLITGKNINGSSGKPNSMVRRASKENSMRISIERSRKKEHRDVEELRANLEKEMESRRRAELDTLFTEIHFCDASRAVAREKTNCCRLKQEARKYRDMERIMRGRLEGAKVLVGQLRGETDEPDVVGGGASRTPLRDGTRRAESLTNGSFVPPSFRTGRNERIAEDDVVMTNKNVTTTSRRLMEMDRLRALIAAREVEAEEFQRVCEKERMHFVTTLELKTRIETELYLNKSQGSITHSFGNSSIVPVVNCMAKDSLKKGDTRGSSTHTTRGPGYTKQKAGSSGKHATGLHFTNNQKLPVSGSRPKPGRAPEAPKQVKRKNIGRSGGNGGNGGNGNDKL